MWCLPAPYSACTESWATVCFITGKRQRERERETCTGPPTASPAGIRAIRERGETERRGGESLENKE